MPDKLYLLAHQPECAIIVYRGAVDAPLVDPMTVRMGSRIPYGKKSPACTCNAVLIEVREGVAHDAETMTFVGRVLE